MIGIVILTIVAFILSIILAFVNNKFGRNENLEKELLNLLPQYNCGACQYAGCQGMANAMLDDPEQYKKCKLLRNESLTKMEGFINKEMRKG